MTSMYPLRPFLASDTMALRDLFAQSIEELTADDYDEDQRLAWASTAVDAEAFAARLASATTLVVQVDGEYLGFASMKDSRHIDMLYVHPHHIDAHVGSTLMDALEKIATARGTDQISVDASDSAIGFFEQRGYIGTKRNSVPLDDQWLSNTTLSKSLEPDAMGQSLNQRPA